MTAFAHDAGRPLGIARKWWVAAVVAVPGVALTELAFTGVLLAGPVVIQALDTDRYAYQWATGPYLVLLLVGVVLTPRIQRVFGSRLPFVAGMLALGLGCLLAGTARSLPQMVVARVFMAAKGLPLALALAQLWLVFPERRGLAMAFYGAAMYGSVALGAALGAFVAFAPSWRAVFLVAGPASLLVALTGWQELVPDRPATPPRQSWDTPGIGLFAVMVGTTVFILFRGQYLGWLTSNWVWLAVGTLLLSLGLFVWRELTVPDPLVDLRFLPFRTLSLTLLTLGLYGGALIGLVNTLPGYLTLRGYPSVTAGWVLLPAGIVLSAAILVSGAISDRAHTVRVLHAGLFIMTLALAWLLKLDLYTPKEWIAGVLSVWAIGAGMVLPTGMRLTFEGQTPDAVHRLASVKVALRFVGTIVGAFTAAVLLVQGTDANHDLLRQKITWGRPAVQQVDHRIIQHLTGLGSSPGAAVPQSSAVVAAWVATNAQVLGYRWAIRYLFVLGLVGFLVSVFIRRRPEASILAPEDSALGSRATSLPERAGP